MVCRDVARLVTAYVDGELDDRRSSALRGHLRVCPPCATRVADEARLRAEAQALEPIEPPPGLWTAIDARLAEEEIGDGRRPAWWLWWQRALDAARRHSVPLTVASVAAAALLLVWITRTNPELSHPVGTSPSPGGARGGDEVPTREEGTSEVPAREEGTSGVPTRDVYQQAIAELDRLVAGERAAWSADAAARFDARLAELDRAAREELARLAVAVPDDPAARDPLHGIYQAKIDLLSAAVVAGDPGGLVP